MPPAIPSSDVTPNSTTTPADTGAVGLADIGRSQSRRNLLDLLNRLYNTGVQADVDIPQIAVIGSQSAGKSSLIESISGVTLPRAAGTCTRCPTECKLSSSNSPWTCIVSLRFTTDVKGQTLGQPRTQDFGPPINEKGQVEERIRRAQRAILNPSTSYNVFLDGDDKDLPKSELSFSTNCVTLQISGAGVADLSFIDLPGLIASVSSGGNSSDIKLVEGLVTSYISKPSCVILLTVACETDFENQGAHHLAKKHDPQGKRTIGVLTKPDRIPTGEENRWIKFIQNEAEPLENNWYCVKQPSSNDLNNGITWTTARQREREFFGTTAPWCNLESTYQKYLGTDNLVERASSILSELIAKRLPKIQEELQKALRKTEQSLYELPQEPSADAFSEVMGLLHGFAVDLSRHVEGVPDDNGLLQTIRPYQMAFRNAIQSTAPEFVPLEKHIVQSEGFEMPKPKFLEQEGEPGDDAKDRNRSAPVYIDQVMERAQRARARELPDNYPFVVRASYVSAITERWHSPARLLCEQIYTILLKYVKRLVQKHFNTLGQGSLEQRVGVILQDHMQKACEGAMRSIEWLINLESRPFTLNENYLADYKDKFLSYYKGVRESHQNPDLMKFINDQARAPAVPSAFTFNSQSSVPPAGIPKIMSGLADIGVTSVKPQDIPKLLPVDTMEPALNIMAEVRAYFQVAHKRFVDNVPLAIDRELIFGLEREILPTLYAGLGINGEAGARICKELTQESRQVAGRREELKKRWERLSAASRELLNIGL